MLTLGPIDHVLPHEPTNPQTPQSALQLFPCVEFRTRQSSSYEETPTDPGHPQRPTMFDRPAGDLTGAALHLGQWLELPGSSGRVAHGPPLEPHNPRSHPREQQKTPKSTHNPAGRPGKVGSMSGLLALAPRFALPSTVSRRSSRCWPSVAPGRLIRPRSWSRSSWPSGVRWLSSTRSERGGGSWPPPAGRPPGCRSRCSAVITRTCP